MTCYHGGTNEQPNNTLSFNYKEIETEFGDYSPLKSQTSLSVGNV